MAKNLMWLKTKMAFSKILKARQASFKSAFMMPEARPTPRNYQQLVSEGYGKNIIVYRCVSLIARSLASVPLEVDCGTDKKQRFESHPLLDLFQTPNFLERLVTTLLLSGHAPVALQSEQNTHKLTLLRPDFLKFDDEKSEFVYAVQGESISLPETFDQSHKLCLILIKLPHPLTDKIGFSPLEAASLSVDQHNAVSEHNLALLQNGGRPLGALMVKTPHGLSLDEKEREEFKNTLRQTYSGPKNAGRILLLEGEMSWQEMGMSLKDMDFVEGKHLSAREIAQAFGVPTMLVGVPGESTFSNYREARFHLWEDTVLPLLDLILREFNRALKEPFEGAKLVYDIEQIPALSQKRESLWNRFENASFLTQNEKREALGYPPLKE